MARSTTRTRRPVGAGNTACFQWTARCPIGQDHGCAAASLPIPCATSMPAARRSTSVPEPGLSPAA